MKPADSSYPVQHGTRGGRTRRSWMRTFLRRRTMSDLDFQKRWTNRPPLPRWCKKLVVPTKAIQGPTGPPVGSRGSLLFASAALGLITAKIKNAHLRAGSLLSFNISTSSLIVEARPCSCYYHHTMCNNSKVVRSSTSSVTYFSQARNSPYGVVCLCSAYSHLPAGSPPDALPTSRLNNVLSRHPFLSSPSTLFLRTLLILHKPAILHVK